MKTKVLSITSVSMIVISFFLILGCNKETRSDADTNLGEVYFTPTGTPAAQEAFHNGLLLLHSFEYDDAQKAFREARTEDPTMAMAYWGEAMTHNHPLWRQQDREAAIAILNELAPSPEERQAKAATPLEKDLLQAADILYGEGSKISRDSAYASYMAQLHTRYPGQHEVAAFYALSLLGAVPVGRDEEKFAQGAQIAKSILAENPQHPGALHYLIHAFDDPEHAALAIQAADRYAKVAPDAAHALHMPSHIYVAMGMWDEVVSSNIASYDASIKRMERLGLDNDARSYHAFAWLLYGQLQKGRYEEARNILQDMIRYTEELPSKSARSYLNRMHGNYLVETGDWEGPMAQVAVNVDDLNIVNRTIRSFIDGMQAYRRQDKEKLADIIKAIEDDRQRSSLLVSDQGTPICSVVGTRAAPNQLDLDQSQVMELELRALYATLTDKPSMADELLSAASQLERSIDYSYGPPDIIYPSFELYGEWLLEQQRYEEAMAQFRYALARGPKRVRALQGLLTAARALDEQATVRETEQLLSKISDEPDANI